MIGQFGDERFARRIARAIVAARPIESTAELAAIVRDAIPAAARRRGGHPAKRTFQAIRIEVNRELEILGASLDDAIDVLAPGGRCAVLAYHSGEDRIVKQRFRYAATGGCSCPPGLPCVCDAVQTVRLLKQGAWTPTDVEIAANPRAESARLRAVEKITPPPPPSPVLIEPIARERLGDAGGRHRGPRSGDRRVAAGRGRRPQTASAHRRPSVAPTCRGHRIRRARRSRCSRSSPRRCSRPCSSKVSSDSTGSIGKSARPKTASTDCRADVAELESPERIVAVAHHRLGMVQPDTITYLAPTLEQVVAVVSASGRSLPDETEVDAAIAGEGPTWSQLKPFVGSAP